MPMELPFIVTHPVVADAPPEYQQPVCTSGDRQLLTVRRFNWQMWYGVAHSPVTI